jgi:hypothetical protein
MVGNGSKVGLSSPVSREQAHAKPSLLLPVPQIEGFRWRSTRPTVLPSCCKK